MEDSWPNGSWFFMRYVVHIILCVDEPAALRLRVGSTPCDANYILLLFQRELSWSK